MHHQSAGRFPGIRRTRQQYDLSLGIELLGRPYQMNESLLASDPSHEHHRRLVKIDAKASDHVGAWVRLEFLGIDAVLDHMHFVWIEIGIGIHRVFAHSRTDGDHRICALEGSLLGPRREPVAASELLGLPRSVRLQ